MLGPRLVLAAMALAAVARAEEFPTANLVSRWVGSNGLRFGNTPVGEGDSYSTLPDSYGNNDLAGSFSSPAARMDARGCHVAMDFTRFSRMTTRDSTSRLDPNGDEWLFYAVGRQTGTSFGSVFERFRSGEARMRLTRGLAFTISAAMFDNYNRSSTDSNGVMKASDVLNMWSVWMVHVKRNPFTTRPESWIIDLYDNNDDSASSAGGISGYSSNTFQGTLRAPSASFTLGGSSAFTGQLLEAGVLRGAGINRTLLQAALDERYHLACPAIAPPGSDYARRAVSPAIVGRDDQCGMPGQAPPRDSASCTQTCSAGAARVAGSEGHVCSMGSWSGSPIVCEGACPQIAAPPSTSVCYQVALGLTFDAAQSGSASGYAGLQRGVLRQMTIEPPVPVPLRGGLWAADPATGVLRTNASATCDSAALPSMLVHSSPLWTSFLSATSGVSIDVTMAFTASKFGTGSLGVVTRVRDPENYYRLVVTLNYPRGNPGTDPATALNATVVLESVRAGTASAILTGSVGGASFSGTTPLRARLLVRAATLTAYVGPQAWPSATPTNAEAPYMYGPAGSGLGTDTVSPVDATGAGSVPAEGSPVPGFAGWTPFYGSAVNLDHGEETAGVFSSGSGWFDDLVIGTDCQAGRACQFGASTMKCVHGCASGYRLANGTASRTCVAGATDGSTGAWTGEQPVCVPVPPSIPPGLGAFDVPEASPADTPVGQPLSEAIQSNASDVTLLFSLSGTAHTEGGIPVFKIAGCSGQIYVDTGGSPFLDHESKPRWDLTVKATPNGEESSAVEFVVSVTVTDVNEAPVIASPANRSIIESAAAGTPVGAPLAWTDPDCPAVGPCDEEPVFQIDSGVPLSWSSAGAGGAPVFTMNNVSGQIIIGPGGGLDFETVPEYRLVVRASSPRDASLFTTSLVTVFVLDGPDPPFVPSEQEAIEVASFDVAPGSAIGGPGAGSLLCSNATGGAAAVDGFFACDVDAGATLSYTIESATDLVTGAGVPGDVIRIGSASGALTWGAAAPTDLPNREVSRVDGRSVFYAVSATVRVSDGSLSASASIDILVLANVTGRPVLTSLALLDADNRTRTFAPSDGGGYWLSFTGDGLDDASVVGVASAGCVVTAEQFRNPVPTVVDVTRCFMFDSTNLRCPVPVGAGIALDCSVSFSVRDTGGDVTTVPAIAAGDLTMSYEAPRLTAACTQTPWPTKGGGLCVLNGTGFGNDPSIVVVDVGDYGSSFTADDAKYQFSARVVSASPDHIIIERPEIYGSNVYFRINVGGGTWQSFSPRATVAPPEILEIRSYTPRYDPQNLETYGYELIDFYGENFGPLRLNNGQTKRMTGCLYRFAANFQYSCSTTSTFTRQLGVFNPDFACYTPYIDRGYQPHNVVRCQIPRWAGTGLSVHVCIPNPNGNGRYCSRGSACTVDGTCIANSNNTVSYKAPRVTSMIAPTNAGTDGGEKVILRGFDFGPVGFDQVSARYGPKGEEPRWISASSCQVTRESRYTYQQAEMSCTMGAMPSARLLAQATDHEWRVTVGTRQSDEAQCCSSYGPPILAGIEGPGAADADTGGGQAVVISGKNFGPAPGPVDVFYYLNLDLEADASAGPSNVTTGIIPIGDGSGAFKIQPMGGMEGCEVTVPHFEVTCRTAPAGGAGLRWEIYAYNRSSVPPLTAYKRPSVTAVETLAGAPLENANPLGGTRVRIRGNDFGPPQMPFGPGFEQGTRTGPLLEWVRYGTAGRYRPMTNVSVLNHTLIEATLGPGLGANQAVVVSVAGQQSPASDAGAAFSFDPPVLTAMAPLSGPAVPADAESGVSADGFKVRGTLTNVPEGYRVQVLFGNREDQTRVQPAIETSVSFEAGDAGAARTASFTFNAPAGAARRRYVQAQVVDPAAPDSQPVVAQGTCAFDYQSPVLSTFQLRRVTRDELLPAEVVLNFPRRADDAYQMTLVGRHLSDAALDAAQGNLLQRVVEVEVDGTWVASTSPQGMAAIYVAAWTDTEITGYIDLPPPPAPAREVRLRIVGQYDSGGPASGCDPSYTLPEAPAADPTDAVETTQMTVTLARPGIDQLVGVPAGGFMTAGGELAAVVVQGPELVRSSDLNVIVADQGDDTKTPCPVAAITALPGSWNEASYVPGTTGTWDGTQTVAQGKEQCKTYYNLTDVSQVASLPASQPCRLFCVTPEGQGDLNVLGFTTTADPSFGSSVPFPYAKPATATAAAGSSVGGAAPTFGTDVPVPSTAPGQPDEGALQVSPDGTGYLRIRGTNFGSDPQVWFFNDSPSLDDVDSYVALPGSSADPFESASHTELVVRAPRGWGTGRRLWVRAPPGELQVSEAPVYFDYRKPQVTGACVWDATESRCAEGAAALARAGSTLRVQVSDLGQPLELASSAAAQFIPISVVVRDGPPPSSALQGLTPAGFCGVPPPDADGHLPIRCVIQGVAPSQDEGGVACPPYAGASDSDGEHASPAQRVPAGLPSLTSDSLLCTLDPGAGSALSVQVAVGPRVSDVVLDSDDRRRGRQLAGSPVSFLPPLVTSAVTLDYAPGMLDSSVSAVVAAIAAQEAATPPGGAPPPLSFNTSAVTSAWPAGNLTGPTDGGYVVVLQGRGFGRNYARSSAPTLAAASRAGGVVPTAPFVGSPPAVPLKRSCLFASAVWREGRTAANTPATPTCDGAASYQGEGEAADATFLPRPGSGWLAALTPPGTDDVAAPVVVAWSDAAVAFRVPPGVGRLALTVVARGIASAVTPFVYEAPVIEGVEVMAPTRVIPAGVDASAITSLNTLNVRPDDYASDSAADYVPLPFVPVSGSLTTDGEQVIVLRGRNFGPAPPLASAYAGMPPANNTLAVPRPVGARFPTSVVSVHGSDTCATAYYQWDIRGTGARVLHTAPLAAQPYQAVPCRTRTTLALAVVPGRLVSNAVPSERRTVLSHGHSAIVLRVPPGVGRGRALRVVVHAYDAPETGPVPPPLAASAPFVFDYAPPLLRRLADPDLRITDAPVAPAGMLLLGASMGRLEDQPADPASLVPRSLAYNVALQRRADGGWNTGGDVRSSSAGVLELKLSGRPCRVPPVRSDVTGNAVMAAAQGESGVVTAVSCGSLDVSGLVVGRHPVEVNVSGVEARLDNSSTVFVGCAVDHYGLVGQTCRPCPIGARCDGMASRSNHTLPVSEPGYYDLGRDRFNLVNPDTRQSVNPATWLSGVCPAAQPAADVGRGICVVPCFPPDACVGDNRCSAAYSSLPQTFTSGDGAPKPSDFKFRCAYCANGYYRRTTACEPCPEQPILLILAFILAVVAVAALGLYLSSKNINVALINTGVDTFQVMSLFSTARINWPDEIRTIFELLSTFSLNIEITAPECLIPSLSYEAKWWMVMLVPIITQAGLAVVFLSYACFKRFIKGQRGRRKFCSHAPKLVSAFMVALYFYYVLVCRKVMDVFDCEPVPNAGDDALYMAAGTLDKCGEPGGLQARLQPFAIFFLIFYTIGFPAVLFYVMRKNRFLIATDQLLRAKGMGFKRQTNSDEGYQLRKMIGRVYFAYRPEIAWVWVQAILMRKLAISMTAILFDNDSSFILTSMALVLIICYAVHVRYLPFMSPGDRPRILRDHTRRVMEGDVTSVNMQRAISDIEARQKKKTKRIDWTDPTRAGGGMSATRRNALALAGSLLVDYNVVEGTMLFITILVSLCGILFNTERFEGTSYDGQRQFITWAVILLITGSLAYFVLVFMIDMHTGIQEAAVRQGKMRPEDVRPPCHAALRCAGMSDLPPKAGAAKSGGKGKGGKSARKELEQSASMRGFVDADDIEGSPGTAPASPSARPAPGAIEMSEAATSSVPGGLASAAITTSANPLFGIQGGAGAIDAKASPADEGAAGGDDDDDVLSGGKVGGNARMSELKRMTANVLAMAQPPSSRAWPELQQLFADLAAQVEAHTQRTRLGQRSEAAAETEAETGGDGSGAKHARAARKMLKQGGGSRSSRKSFAQARLGSSRRLGAGSTGMSMRALNESAATGRRLSEAAKPE